MTETKLLAYHDDPAIKAKYMAIVEGHRLADEIVQGYGYWDDGKGCAVGCTLHSDRHQDYPAELGIPEVLAWLEDLIFECIPVVEARRWPGRFLAAPEPGADLSLVWPKFAVWLLSSDDLGLPRMADRAGKLALAQVVALHQRTIEGDHPSPFEWTTAALAAGSAVSSAEGAASRLTALSAEGAASVSAPILVCRLSGWPAAREAAMDAARASGWGCPESVAWLADHAPVRGGPEAAPWRAAVSAAVKAACLKMADRLLALMAEAPVAAH